MPTQYTIPAQTKRICAPCEHHECIGALHVRIGEGGYREYACNHPDAHPPLPPNTPPEIIEQLLKLRCGRYIGKTEDQPDWCPLRAIATTSPGDGKA